MNGSTRRADETGARLRILLLALEYPPVKAGAGRLTHYLATGLDELGHDVTVIAPACGRAGREFDAAQTYSIRRMRLPRHRMLRVMVSGIRFLLMRRLARPWQIVCFCESGAHVAAAPVAPFIGEYGLFTHGSEFAWYFGDSGRSWRSTLKARLMRRLFTGAHVIACNSGDTRRRLLSFLPDVEPSAKVVVPGIPISEPRGGEASRRRSQTGRSSRSILTVARLSPDKGHDMVLEAMAYPELAGRDLVCRIAGTGNDRTRLEKVAEALGIRDRVVFLGEISDEALADEYATADLFVLATRGDGTERVEGFGLVFAEALAHGLPVIGGRVGGVPEAVREGVDGILVDPRSPREIADAIALLLDNAALRHRMGERGRLRARTELSTRAMAERFLAAVQVEVVHYR